MTNRIGGQKFRTTGRPPDRDWMDQGKELLRKLRAILTPVVPAPARAPEPSAMYKLVQLLIGELAENRPVPPAPPALVEPTKLGNDVSNVFQRKTVAVPTPTGTT